MVKIDGGTGAALIAVAGAGMLGMGLLLELAGIVGAVLLWRTDAAIALVALLVPLLFVGVGAALLVAGLRARRSYQRISSHGQLAWARITGRGSRRGRHGAYRFLRFTYLDGNGVLHEGSSDSMSGAELDRWQPGDLATIQYDPADPAEYIWLGGEPQREVPEAQTR